MADNRIPTRRVGRAGPFLLSLALSTLALSVAPASAAAQDRAEQERDPIIVQAERDRAKAARELAKDVTRSLKIRTPLERFRDPICPYVIGAEPQAAYAIEGRIKANAEQAGLTVGDRNCQKNMLIAFVADAPQELRTLLAKKRRSFGNLTSFERKRLERESGPTRAWHVVIPGDADGNTLLTAEDGTPVSVGTHATRISTRYTRLIESSVVLIELSATSGKTLDQIADFATMRGLMPVVEIGADAHSTGTILSLFDGESEVSGLTSFDRAYLKAYNSDNTIDQSGLATMFDVGRKFARPDEEHKE